MSTQNRLLFALLALLALPPLAQRAVAAPPVPARIGGTLTIDGVQATHESTDVYAVSVLTTADGETFEEVAATQGLNEAGWYSLNIPIFDADEQPDGLNPGEEAWLRLTRNGVAQVIASPTGGRIVVGESASVAEIDVAAGPPPLPPPPVPARIGGTLTLDGQTLSPSEAGEYTIRVVRLDGSEYMPRAETRGLNDQGWYSINIPIFDEIIQPGGATPGETGVMEILFEDAPIAKVFEPEKAWVTVGESASATTLDIVAELQTRVDVRPLNVSGEAGGTIVVPIMIQVGGAALEMDAIGFSLSFDADSFDWVDVDSAGTLTGGFTLLSGREIEAGLVKVAGALFDQPVLVSADGVLLNLRFTVADDASGDFTFALTDFKDDIAGATTADAVFSVRVPPTPPTPPSPPPTDTVPPVITLMGDAEISVPAGTPFVDPGATASDNRDGDVSNRIVVEGAVDTDTPGTYPLTYTVRDFSGNAAEPVTRTVTVTPAEGADTTPPVISLLGEATVRIPAGASFVDPGARAEDDTDGDISAQIAVQGSVDTATPGIYTLTYTIRDAAGNAAEPVTRDVVVTPPVGVDDTPPVIALAGPATVEISTGETFADPGATAIDDVDGDISGRIVVEGTVDTATPGTYILTYTVRDAAGNAAEPAIRTVIVGEPTAPEDATPPELTVDATDVVEIPPGGTFTPPAAVAADDADGDLSGQIEVAGTVDPLTPGTYTLIYSVTDAAGNAADPVSVRVVVTDSEAAADLSATPGSLTTFRSVDLPETGRIPFDLVLRPGGSDTSPMLRLAAGTVVLTASDAPFGGILPAPVRTEASPSIRAELGPDAVAFRLADSDTPLFLSGGSPGWLTVTVVLPEGAADPTLWRTDPGGGVSPAGLEGEMDGIAVSEGGTVIDRAADTPEPGFVAVTLVALVDELGTYAAGDRSEADGGGGGGCFIGAVAK